MIGSFGDRITQRVWEGIRTRQLPGEVQQVAEGSLG